MRFCTLKDLRTEQLHQVPETGAFIGCPRGPATIQFADLEKRHARVWLHDGVWTIKVHNAENAVLKVGKIIDLGQHQLEVVRVEEPPKHVELVKEPPKLALVVSLPQPTQQRKESKLAALLRRIADWLER
jgi:hypothetical protein